MLPHCATPAAPTPAAPTPAAPTAAAAASAGSVKRGLRMKRRSCASQLEPHSMVASRSRGSHSTRTPARSGSGGTQPGTAPKSSRHSSSLARRSLRLGQLRTRDSHRRSTLEHAGTNTSSWPMTAPPVKHSALISVGPPSAVATPSTLAASASQQSAVWAHGKDAHAARTSFRPDSPASQRLIVASSSASPSAARECHRPSRSAAHRAVRVSSRLGSHRGPACSHPPAASHADTVAAGPAACPAISPAADPAAAPAAHDPMAWSSSCRLIASAAAYAICAEVRGRAAQSLHCIALSSDLPVHARSCAARPASEDVGGERGVESVVERGVERGIERGATQALRHASRRSTTRRAVSGRPSDCSCRYRLWSRSRSD